VRKIRIYPKAEQKRLLDRWLGAARWTYNACLAAVRGGTARSLTALRAACVTEDALARSGNAWATDIPFDVRDSGCRDYLKAHAAALAGTAARRAHTGSGAFEMQPRCKKSRRDAMDVLGKHWGTQEKGYVEVFGAGRMTAAELLPARLAYDARLLR
jgi:hypothetical protein